MALRSRRYRGHSAVLSGFVNSQGQLDGSEAVSARDPAEATREGGGRHIRV